MGSEKVSQNKEADTRFVQQKSQGGALNIIDNRPEAAAQRKMQNIMQGGETAQRAPEEEEMMQGKFEVQRAPEEEEMPQG